MKGKALFAAGVAVGYVWGSKSWPEVYRRVRGGAQKVWKNPEVQENVHQATEAVQETVPDILDNLYAAGRKFLERAEAMFPGILESKSGPHGGSSTGSTASSSTTGSTSTGSTSTPPVRPDVVSDPALDDTTGSDWTDEGGAAPEGPATNTPPKP
ncbi:hypothetical protein [Arthrobacter sp. StoSoilB5]|uniref:hypothetical protein n=1 Tax=Arthrobacter sp. StoSoilB5 TaxID=2830992 RepID=UPI001CC4D7E5|nr:hypothetical protein [Arthrobacter sp. StoSoilB5]BCW47404.1 hypothetical protein StoSoilB5_45880 [Arthrobacter sp. StoSoilB5]